LPVGAAGDEASRSEAAAQLRLETTYDGIRYIAQSLDLGIHPHTPVTKSLPELRAALNAAQP